MNQLTPNMYRPASFSERFSKPSTLFGLREGQMRFPDTIHNGRWYNMNGERIGCGDLSSADILRISNEIDPDEIFFVLNEHDGDEAGYEPGINAVQSKTFMAITRGHIYYVARHSHYTDPQRIAADYGIPKIEILSA